MTDATAVSEEMVDAATLAMLKACAGECIEAPPGGLCAERLGCACRAEARAAIIAAIPLVVAGERERCAKIAERVSGVLPGGNWDYGVNMPGKIARAIRADTGDTP